MLIPYRTRRRGPRPGGTFSVQVQQQGTGKAQTTSVSVQSELGRRAAEGSLGSRTSEPRSTSAPIAPSHEPRPRAWAGCARSTAPYESIMRSVTRPPATRPACPHVYPHRNASPLPLAFSRGGMHTASTPSAAQLRGL